jgi:hypothetical protein
MSKVDRIAAALPVRRKTLQDAFLSAAIAQRAPVVAHLRSGVKLEGRIVGYARRSIDMVIKVGKPAGRRGVLEVQLQGAA